MVDPESLLNGYPFHGGAFPRGECGEPGHGDLGIMFEYDGACPVTMFGQPHEGLRSASSAAVMDMRRQKSQLFSSSHPHNFIPSGMFGPVSFVTFGTLLLLLSVTNPFIAFLFFSPPVVS